MGGNRKKRRTYPDVPERLASPIVDNHTHLPVRGDRDYAAMSFDVESGIVDSAGEGAASGALEGSRRDADKGDGIVSNGTRSSEGLRGAADGKLHAQEANPPGAEEARQGSIPWHIARMEAAGVRHAITCGCDIPTLEPTVALAERYPSLSAAIGIHPNEAPLHRGVTEASPDGLTHGLDPWHRDYSLEEAVAEVASLAVSTVVVAIGETGLDYYRTADAGKKAQEEAFRMHIELAKDLDLPMQIHDREAHADCMRILRECGAPERTIFHCFSGDREMAEICARNGWYASFAGPISYPANEGLREAFLAMPEELVLVETDAPYLAPMPWRGHPNAPYVSACTARFMADLRGVDEALWCRRLDVNAREVYGV